MQCRKRRFSGKGNNVTRLATRQKVVRKIFVSICLLVFLCLPESLSFAAITLDSHDKLADLAFDKVSEEDVIVENWGDIYPDDKFANTLAYTVKQGCFEATLYVEMNRADHFSVQERYTEEAGRLSLEFLRSNYEDRIELTIENFPELQRVKNMLLRKCYRETKNCPKLLFSKKAVDAFGDVLILTEPLLSGIND